MVYNEEKNNNLTVEKHSRYRLNQVNPSNATLTPCSLLVIRRDIHVINMGGGLDEGHRTIFAESFFKINEIFKAFLG